MPWADLRENTKKVDVEEPLSWKQGKDPKVSWRSKTKDEIIEEPKQQ